MKKNELSTIIRAEGEGFYYLIETDRKLKILRELVEEAIQTSTIRKILSQREKVSTKCAFADASIYVVF